MTPSAVKYYCHLAIKFQVLSFLIQFKLFKGKWAELNIAQKRNVIYIIQRLVKLGKTYKFIIQVFFNIQVYPRNPKMHGKNDFSSIKMEKKNWDHVEEKEKAIF